MTRYCLFLHRKSRTMWDVDIDPKLKPDIWGQDIFNVCSACRRRDPAPPHPAVFRWQQRWLAAINGLPPYPLLLLCLHYRPLDPTHPVQYVQY